MATIKFRAALVVFLLIFCAAGIDRVVECPKARSFAAHPVVRVASRQVQVVSDWTRSQYCRQGLLSVHEYIPGTMNGPRVLANRCGTGAELLTACRLVSTTFGAVVFLYGPTCACERGFCCDGLATYVDTHVVHSSVVSMYQACS